MNRCDYFFSSCSVSVSNLTNTKILSIVKWHVSSYSGSFIYPFIALHVSCIICHYGRNSLNSPWKRDKIRWWEINVYFCKWISNTTTSINWADLCRWYFRFIIGCAQHIYTYINTHIAHTVLSFRLFHDFNAAMNKHGS